MNNLSVLETYYLNDGTTLKYIGFDGVEHHFYSPKCVYAVIDPVCDDTNTVSWKSSESYFHHCNPRAIKCLHTEVDGVAWGITHGSDLFTEILEHKRSIVCKLRKMLTDRADRSVKRLAGLEQMPEDLPFTIIECTMYDLNKWLQRNYC